MNTYKLNGEIYDIHSNVDDDKDNVIANKYQSDNLWSLLFICLKGIFMTFKSKLSQKFLNFSFHIKLMIMFAPFLIFMVIILVMTHSIEYEENFISDYVEIYHSHYFNRDNFLIKISELEIKETLNKSFQNLVFIKIYSKEMINKNILEGEVYLNHTNPVYSNIDFLNGGFEFSNLMNYSVDFDDIDKNNEITKLENNPSKQENNINNLLKSLYLFSPLFLQNHFFQNLNPSHSYYIFSSYTSDKIYEHSNYFYYPRRINKQRIYSDPSITDNNWFNHFHREFLNSNDVMNKLEMLTSYEDLPKIGLSKKEQYIPISQTKFVHDNHIIILEVISKYSINISSKKEYESYSLINLSKNLTNMINTPTKRFIDDRVVIGSIPVIPLAIPKIYNIYYRKGMVPYDKSLQIFGYNSDVIDFTKFNMIDDYYKLDFSTVSDSLPFLMIYFYNSFSLKILEDNIRFPSNDTEQNNLFQLILPIEDRSSLIIKQVCDSFNITHYLFHHYLMHSEINCLAKEEVKIYKMFNELLFQDNQDIYGDETSYAVPRCECLPFYCFDLNNMNNPIYRLNDLLNLLESDNEISLGEFLELKDKFIYADRMFLPKKCKLSFKGYKKSIYSNNTNSFTLEFYTDNNQMMFNPKMSHISMYIISNDDSEYLIDKFTFDLKDLVTKMIGIYSILLVGFILTYLAIISKKFKLIQNTIKEIAFKFDHIKEISENIHDKNISKLEIPKYEKKLSTINIRNSMIYYNNSPTMNLPIEDKIFLVKSSNVKIMEKKRESRLDIIKENDEIENDESVLIDRKNFSSKKTIHIIEKLDSNNKANNYSLNKSVDNNTNLNISPLKISNNSNEAIKHKISAIPNDEVIQELILTNNSYDTIGENDFNSSLDQSELTKSINLSVKNADINKLVPINLNPNNKIKKDNKKITTDFNNILKAINEIKLDDSFQFINLKSFFLKLGEEEINKNFYLDEFLLKKCEKTFYNKKKFMDLVDNPSNHTENTDQDLLNIKENSKSLLSEVFSTEICSFQDLALNFGFKYRDNEYKIFEELNLKFSNEEMNSVSFIDEYIDNVETNLKLKEKCKQTDVINFIFESGIYNDDHTDSSGIELLKFDHIKSVVNYYLENILLSGLKKIYQEKYKNSFE